MPRKKPVFWILLLAAASLVLALTAILLGSSGATPAELWRALVSGEASPTRTILLSIRVPRVALSYLVGAALALAGCVMQGIFRNPMADAHVLGVSSGAALGAAIAMLAPIPVMLQRGALAVTAFAGGLGAAFLVYALARVKGRVTPIGLLLAGISVAALLSAGTSLMLLLNRAKLERVLLWTMGSFSSATWQSVAWSLPPILIGALGCAFWARDLNAMLLGDEEARLLGVRVSRGRALLMVFSTLAVSGAVSVSGVIGFIGLMVPHAMRFVVGPDHRRLLPASALAGGLFLLFMDTLARTVAAPIELPVGLLTSVCGGPFFLYLLRRHQGEASS